MNYELSTEVIKILDDLGKRFGIAVDWTSKNVMPYLMELYDKFITYKIVVNCIPIVLFVVFLIITIVFLKKYFKYNALARKTNETNWATRVIEYTYQDNHYSMSELCFGVILILAIVDFVIAGATCFTIGNLLKLIFVPELYVVDYLSTYM